VDRHRFDADADPHPEPTFHILMRDPDPILNFFDFFDFYSQQCIFLLSVKDTIIFYILNTMYIEICFKK
jgi:hypothetical protein